MGGGIVQFKVNFMCTEDNPVSVIYHLLVRVHPQILFFG